MVVFFKILLGLLFVFMSILFRDSGRAGCERDIYSEFGRDEVRSFYWVRRVILICIYKRGR